MIDECHRGGAKDESQWRGILEYFSPAVQLGLEDAAPHPGSVWNRLPDETRADVVEFALEHEELTPRELAVKYTDEKQYFVSESSVYRILKAEDLVTAPAHIVMKAANEFRDQTTRPNELWQTDFTYLKVLGWGWFYLSTILDDYSRYIIAWKLCTTMKAEDVTATLDLALEASGCDSATVIAKPRLLSDNGSSYIASDLADYLDDKGMDHVRGAPYHPQTQGKIERWHQTMKNRVLLEHYFLPGDLERQVGAFVEYYNTRRYHESLGNLTPADVYYGRGDQILKQREEIKRRTILARRLRHETENAQLQSAVSQTLQSGKRSCVPNYLTTDSQPRRSGGRSTGQTVCPRSFRGVSSKTASSNFKSPPDQGRHQLLGIAQSADNLLDKHRLHAQDRPWVTIARHAVYMRHDTFEIAPFPDLTGFCAPSDKGKRLRVCIATEEIIGPVRNGGIASTYYYLARLLVSQGHHVTVLYLKGNRSENGHIGQWIDFYAELGVEFVPLPSEAGEGVINQWQLRHYSAYVWLKNQAVPFDIVHASEWRGGAYYALLAKKQGIAFDQTLFLIKASSPHVWNRHYMMEYIQNAALLPIMYPEQMSIELADLVIGGSAHLLRFMEHMGYTLPAERTYVQPNVLEFDSLEIPDQRGVVTHGDRVKTGELVFFGRLEARKGLQIFCDALDFLVARGIVPQRVAFLGKEGGNLPTSPNLANKAYISFRAKAWPFEIEIHDEFDQPQALSFLMEKPRIAVMPSLVENSSMAVYETLVYKIPFLATKVGGTPELVHETDRDSVLVEANPRSLANGMAEVLQKGGLVARCAFDNDANLQTWKDFHEHLSARKSAGDLASLSATGGSDAAPNLTLCLYSDGDANALKALLDTCAFTGGEDLAEIVVAAADMTPEIEKATVDRGNIKVRLVDARERSIGEAWNAAAASATGEVLFFLRSDIHTPLTGFAATLRRAFAASGAVAFGSVWRHRGKDPDDRKIRIPIGADLAMAVINREALSGRGVAISADTFSTLGGFDEIFGMGGIEQDLLIRASDHGDVQIIPEPLYIEDPDRAYMVLNEHNAQFMAASSRITAAPHDLKRLHLALGMLDNPDKLLRPGVQVASADPSLATFINNSPINEEDYESRPRLRIILDEDASELLFILEKRKMPATLEISINDKPHSTLPLERGDDGTLYGRWDLKGLGMSVKPDGLTLRAGVEGEPKGPARKLKLSGITPMLIAVMGLDNKIERPAPPALPADPALATFVNHHPIDEAGYENRPRLRVALNEAEGKLVFFLEKRSRPATLAIAFDGEFHTTIPATPRDDNVLFAQCSLRDLDRMVSPEGLLFHVYVEGETNGPSRKLKLAATDSSVIEVLSPNPIEIYSEPDVETLSKADNGIASVEDALWTVECGEQEAPRMQLAFNPDNAIFRVRLGGNAAELEVANLVTRVNGAEVVTPFDRSGEVPQAEFAVVNELLRPGENQVVFRPEQGPDDLMRKVSITGDGNVIRVWSRLFIKTIRTEELESIAARRVTVT